MHVKGLLVLGRTDTRTHCGAGSRSALDSFAVIWIVSCAMPVPPVIDPLHEPDEVHWLMEEMEAVMAASAGAAANTASRPAVAVMRKAARRTLLFIEPLRCRQNVNRITGHPPERLCQRARLLPKRAHLEPTRE